jgi:hypothetical protein
LIWCRESTELGVPIGARDPTKTLIIAMESIGNFNREWGPGSVLIHTEKVRSVDMLRARGAEEAHELARWLAHAPHGIVT